MHTSTLTVRCLSLCVSITGFKSVTFLFLYRAVIDACSAQPVFSFREFFELLPTGLNPVWPLAWRLPPAFVMDGHVNGAPSDFLYLGKLQKLEAYLRPAGGDPGLDHLQRYFFDSLCFLEWTWPF